ncbi:four helix bundle protein, partial [Anaerovorax odorimutans]
CGRTTQKDKANFFQTSYASAQETEYILLLSKDLGFLPEVHYTEVLEMVVEVKSMMSSLIKKVKAIANEG